MDNQQGQGTGAPGAGAPPTDSPQVAKAIQKNVGSDFLASTVHVARGSGDNQKVVAIPGGRMLSELEGDQKLKGAEVEHFRRHGAIRPASVEDIRSAEGRNAASEAAAADAERANAFAELEAQHEGERQEVILEYTQKMNQELAKLATNHDKERAALTKKFTKESASK
jgi:hypothetical protein